MDSSLSSNLSELCERLSVLGQTRRTIVRASTMFANGPDINMDATDDQPVDPADNVGDPDFYVVNYVPLPQILPWDEGQMSRFSEFRTSFHRVPKVVNGKTVLACGVSLVECLQETSEMIDGEAILHSGWGEHSGGIINVPITWPGYDKHSIAEICIYKEVSRGLGLRRRITRAELAKQIAIHYFLFFDVLTVNEMCAENNEPHHEDGISQDPLWKVGFRGYMFDRLHIMSVTQTFDNFCKVELSVMTAKGFPETVMFP